MGTSPLGMIVSPAKPFTGWPTDTVVYRG
jgi:hypothetical protein